MILKMEFNSFKKLLFILPAIILPMLSFAAGQETVLLQKGNTLYAKAQYKPALEAYQSVLKMGYESAALYYNTGNASFKTGDVPSALLYYEKAHRLEPANADIQANIRFVNSKITDKIEELPEFFLTKWWNSVILGFSLNTLSFLSLFLIFAGSGLLILYFFAHAALVKRIAFYAAMVFFVTGAFTVFIGNRHAAYFRGNKEAIVFSSTVTVKAAPAEQSKALFVVHEGTKVKISESNNGWTRIRLGNGNEGWLKASDFKEI